MSSSPTHVVRSDERERELKNNLVQEKRRRLWKSQEIGSSSSFVGARRRQVCKLPVSMYLHGPSVD